MPNREFLGILFDCCHLYARLYKNSAGTAYEGVCPRCRRRLRVGIGPGGSQRRMFVARPWGGA